MDFYAVDFAYSLGLVVGLHFDDLLKLSMQPHSQRVIKRGRERVQERG